MKTIHMEIDDTLLSEVERATKMSGATRSEFICKAIKLLLKEAAVPDLEKQHREGYAKYPVSKGEFSEWEPEQAWGDQ